MKILITGSGGQLGKELIKSSPKIIKEKKIELFPLTKNEFNLSNENQIKLVLEKIQPDWVINCGAYTNVEKAEEEKEIALKINGLGPKYIADTLLKTGGKMIQISTDFVFDGNKNKPYLPNEERNPLNVYGEGKALGESMIEKYLIPFNKGYIVRTSWLIGCFKNNFAQRIISLSRNKDTINVVKDQVSCTTSTKTLSKACWEIIKRDSENIKLPHILHFSDLGTLSWFDAATTVVDIAKKFKIINPKFEVIPITSSQYPTKAVRPRFTLLDCTETYQALKLEPLFWKDALNEVILEQKNNNVLEKFPK